MSSSKKSSARTRHRVPAKVSVPVLPRVLARRRLFAQLDRALAHRVTWIAAAPGAGKTTLVASYMRVKRRPTLWDRLDESDADLSSFVHYLAVATTSLSRSRTPLPALTPDYMFGLSVFLRRFFERVSERVPRRSVIVFDNYQDVPSGAPLHDLLPLAVAELGSHVSVVIASREAPPPSFAAIEARGDLVRLPADDLDLTEDEQRALVSLHHPRATPAATRAWLESASLAKGWMAGAVLLLQRGSAATAKDAAPRHDSRQTVFAYLTREIVERGTPAEQQFLLMTSLLPEFTNAMAASLTGAPFATEFLASLYKSRLFVEQTHRDTAWYRYHPLLRECLLSLAHQRLGPHVVVDTSRKGGQLLLAAGRIEDGHALLAAAGDWDGFVLSALTTAPSLVKQGRLQTLEQWIRLVPAERYAQTPWLQYWLCVCLLPRHPAEAERHARLTTTEFRRAGDVVGTTAAWSLAVLAVMAGMGDFSALDDLIQDAPCADANQLSQLPTPLMLQVTDALAAALAWREPGTPRTDQWIARARELKRLHPVDGTAFPFPFVETYYLWQGDHRTAREAFRDYVAGLGRGATDVAKQGRLYAEAVLFWYGGDSTKFREATASGVALSRREGLMHWGRVLSSQAVYNEIMAGDLDAAARLVDEIRPPRSVAKGVWLCQVTFLDAWCQLHQGELDRAWELVDPIRHKPGEQGGPIGLGFASLLRTYIKFMAGDMTAAASFSNEADAVAEQMNSDLIRHGVAFTKALLAFAGGDDAAGYAALTLGLEIGRRRELWGCPGWHAPTVATLLSKALDAGIEVDYVAQLIRKRWLPRPPEAVLPSSWAWPVKIHALGGFDVRIGNAPLATRRKAPHRLLEVLRAIIALGGTNVSVSTLIDGFWPNADGDVAKENIDKTLQRLRHLLGHADVLPVRSGRVSLNAEVCWVDALAFESLVSRGDSEATAAALSLYRGPLFGEVGNRPWELRARARLARVHTRVSADSAAGANQARLD